jgi:hypothetical protein
MATSTSALTLTTLRSGRRRLLMVAGGITLAAATIVGATVAVVNLAATPTASLAIDRAPVAQEQLHQHVLRENGAAFPARAAPVGTSSMLGQHVLRENSPAPADASSTLRQHVLRENGAAASS